MDKSNGLITKIGEMQAESYGYDVKREFIQLQPNEKIVGVKGQLKNQNRHSIIKF